MSNLASMQNKTCTWPISVGAEGIAAAQFARCGFDVLVQSGYDKPWYDLGVTKAGNLMKVSVKASETGHWGLAHSFTRPQTEKGGSQLNSRRAIDLWLDSQGTRTVCCLVQFEGVGFHQLPRMYLALPYEIALKMRETVDRVGQCVLYEEYAWTSPEDGMESLDRLPASWRFSPERIEELMSCDWENAPAGTAAAKNPAIATRWAPDPKQAKVAAMALTA